MSVASTPTKTPTKSEDLALSPSSSATSSPASPVWGIDAAKMAAIQRVLGNKDEDFYEAGLHEKIDKLEDVVKE